MHSKTIKNLKIVRPPKEFVLMDRAAVGLGSVFMHLSAEINWHNLFHELIDNYNVSKLEKAQNELFKLTKLSKSLLD